MALCSLQRGAVASIPSPQLRGPQEMSRRPTAAPVGSRRAAGWRVGASSGGKSGGGSGGSGGGSGGDLLNDRLAGALLNDPVSFLGGVFAGFLALNLQQGEREGCCRPPHLPSAPRCRCLPSGAYRPPACPPAALPLCLPAEPLRSWIDQTSAEAGLKYQATVERLEEERRVRSGAAPK